MAFASISSSCLRQRRQDQTGKRFSPRLALRAELHVLEHGEQAERLRELERADLAHPRHLKAGTSESDVPSNAHVPASGLSKPVSRLNSVVLPAPFGPMSAVMAPRGISRCVDVDGGEAAEACA